MPKSKHRKKPKRSAPGGGLRCTACGAPAVARCPCPNHPGKMHWFCASCHEIQHRLLGASLAVADEALGLPERHES